MTAAGLAAAVAASGVASAGVSSRTGDGGSVPSQQLLVGRPTGGSGGGSRGGDHGGAVAVAGVPRPVPYGTKGRPSVKSLNSSQESVGRLLCTAASSLFPPVLQPPQMSGEVWQLVRLSNWVLAGHSVAKPCCGALYCAYTARGKVRHGLISKLRGKAPSDDDVVPVVLLVLHGKRAGGSWELIPLPFCSPACGSRFLINKSLTVNHSVPSLCTPEGRAVVTLMPVLPSLGDDGLAKNEHCVGRLSAWMRTTGVPSDMREVRMGVNISYEDLANLPEPVYKAADAYIHGMDVWADQVGVELSDI